MAKRYRYAIIKKKESSKGKLSVGLAIASLLLFVAAVVTAYGLAGEYGFIVGGLCLFAALLSATDSLWDLPAFQKKTVCTGPIS